MCLSWGLCRKNVSFHIIVLNIDIDKQLRTTMFDRYFVRIMEAPRTDDVSAASASTGRSDPMLDERWKRYLPFDIAVLCLVPVTLFGLFLLPEPVRRAAAISFADPTVRTAFTAHFIHLSTAHLLGNILGFVLLGTVAYGLSIVAGHRRLFWVATITFLVAFPFVLSALNLVIPRNAIGYGFSGVNMAVFGYVVVILPMAADARTGTNTRSFVPALFFCSVAYIALIALPTSSLSLAIVGAAIASALPYARRVDTDALRAALAVGRELRMQPGVGELVDVAVVVIVAYPMIGFPSGSAAGLQINIYVHFLGYAMAVLVVHISLLFDDTVSSWLSTAGTPAREPAHR